MVVHWKQQHEQRGAVGRPQFTGRGVTALSEQEARFKKLERELEITRQERDMLKKALAFMSRTAPVLVRAARLTTLDRMRTLARFFAKEN